MITPTEALLAQARQALKLHTSVGVVPLMNRLGEFQKLVQRLVAEIERLENDLATLKLSDLSCPVCKGTGEMKDSVQGWDVGEPAPTCETCKGKGRLGSGAEFLAVLDEIAKVAGGG